MGATAAGAAVESPGIGAGGGSELVFKGAGVSLQDAPPGQLDLLRVGSRVVAIGAPALGAAGGREGKALAV